MSQRQITEITEGLHDYAELVIELWTAYMTHGLNLYNLGGGDSREGIDKIAQDATHFLTIEAIKEAEGWWWDGGRIEAVQSWAHWCAQLIKYGYDEPFFDITKYMEPKEKV